MPAQVEEQVEVYEGKKILEYYMIPPHGKAEAFPCVDASLRHLQQSVIVFGKVR